MENTNDLMSYKTNITGRPGNLENREITVEKLKQSLALVNSDIRNIEAEMITLETVGKEKSQKMEELKKQLALKENEWQKINMDLIGFDYKSVMKN